jgi:hypothetical protein
MADEPKRKDFWDKVTIVLHPMGGLLTALAVTYVGMKGSQVLDRRQSVETNARLYSELMSRREEAESSLRKDMFVSIISSFLSPSREDLDGKVLNLELLAYNFNDSLNLKPLFLDIQRRLQKSTDADRESYAQRIIRVAKETTAKQLFSLQGQGKSFIRSVDFDELAKAGPAGIPLDPETITVRKTTCEVGVRVLRLDKNQEQLLVRLEVKFPGSHPEIPDTRATFNVGYFDFPVIDNTRLTNGLRCAVTLTNYSKDAAADLTTVCFPGEFASLKDRPYYDEVIQKLREANMDEDAATPPSDGSSASPRP